MKLWHKDKAAGFNEDVTVPLRVQLAMAGGISVAVTTWGDCYC